MTHGVLLSSCIQYCVLLRPREKTALAEPRPSPCGHEANMRLVVAVFSAPGNSLARATIRKTWARKLQEFPGVKLVFMLGRHADSTLHVSWRRKISDDVRKNIY